MDSPDNYFERLRKEREETKESMGLGPRWEGPPFVEFATMFKLESRPRPAATFNVQPRQLECVNCGWLLPWATYTLDPVHFDRVCSECKVRSRDFYKTRPHQEVNDAEERNNGGIPKTDLPGSD